MSAPDDGKEYPYLVNNGHHGDHTDDVEMHEGHSTVSGASSSSRKVYDGYDQMYMVDIHTFLSGNDDEDVKYIAIDTNAFLDHLRLIKALRTLLETLDPRVVILVPTTVINELDRLATSNRIAGISPEGDVKISDLARNATSWLLEVNRAQRAGGKRLIRCQRLSEKLDSSTTKGDDKIVDCCLYFLTGRPGSVCLWTNDQNLSLLAEANDIPTTGGHHVSLQQILELCKIEMTAENQTFLNDLEAQSRQESIVSHTSENVGDGHMDLDVDLILAEIPDRATSSTFTELGLTTPRTTPRQSYSTRSSSDSPTKRPSTSTSFPPTPPKSTSEYSNRQARISPQTSAGFIKAFQPFVSAISPNFDTHDITPARLVTTLLNELTKIENQRPMTDTEEHILLLQIISAVRTIDNHLSPASFSRRPRSKEVGDAIELLAEHLPGIVGVGSREDLMALAIEMKNSYR